MDVHSAWQALNLSYWAGSGGALGLGLAPWSPPPFAWQAWHLATWTCILCGRTLIVLGWLRWHAWAGFGAVVAAAVLRGRRGTWRHRSSLCVAGVALGDMDVHSAWQAWHLSYWAGSGGALGLCLAPWSPPPLAWQAWHLATWTCILRGRRGTYRAGLALVAHFPFIPIPSLIYVSLPLIGRSWHVVFSGPLISYYFFGTKRNDNILRTIAKC